MRSNLAATIRSTIYMCLVYSCIKFIDFTSAVSRAATATQRRLAINIAALLSSVRCNPVGTSTHYDADNRMIYAKTADDVEVTEYLNIYYAFDRIRSCSTLKTWLEDCGVETSRVDIVYMSTDRGETQTPSIYIASLDLDTKMELLSGKPLEWDTVILGSVGGKCIYSDG